MTILSIENLEKLMKDNVLFPPFNLTINQSEVKAIHSTLNTRSTLLDMFIGQSLFSGGIYVNGKSISQQKERFLSQVGICFFNDGVYERLTVKDHFSFFKDLYGFNQRIDLIIDMTQLEEKKLTKIRDLSYSEKKRVQYGRVLIQNPCLYIFEEADLNVDVETKVILVQIIKKLQQQGKAILILTSNMESAITMADQVYSLNEDGLRSIDIGREEEDREEDKETMEKEQEEEAFQFNKIPSKINDKIILFDPPEIDYIESNEGQSNIHIRGESLPCMFTLNDLEERLRHFGFFRCHRSYIVNLQKVREVITWTRNSYSLILDDKSSPSIPLSKTKMAELKDMLGLK